MVRTLLPTCIKILCNCRRAYISFCFSHLLMDLFVILFSCFVSIHLCRNMQDWKLYIFCVWNCVGWLVWHNILPSLSCVVRCIVHYGDVTTEWLAFEIWVISASEAKAAERILCRRRTGRVGKFVLYFICYIVKLWLVLCEFANDSCTLISLVWCKNISHIFDTLSSLPVSIRHFPGLH